MGKLPSVFTRINDDPYFKQKGNPPPMAPADATASTRRSDSPGILESGINLVKKGVDAYNAREERIVTERDNYIRQKMIDKGIDPAKYQGTMEGAIPDYIGGPKGTGKILTEAEKLANETKGFDAWHGSPYKFDKFRDNFMAGEGSNAYGQGHYVAENINVAKRYRPKGKEFIIGGNPIDIQAQHFLHFVRDINGKKITNPEKLSSAAIDAANKEIEGYIAAIGQNHPDIPKIRSEHEQLINTIKSWRDAGGISRPVGALYRVHVNADPANMLNYNKILEDQPQVIAKLEKEFGDEFKYFMDELDYKSDMSGLNPTGKDLHQAMLFEHGNNSYLPSAFQKAGVEGIQYLDNASRKIGKGTSNYVIFDANKIKILEAMAAAGIVQAQNMLATKKPVSQK